MREISEKELKQIERRGGKVPPRRRAKPKTEPKAVPESETVSAPPPNHGPSPQAGYPDRLTPLVEAQNQLMAHNSAVLEKFGQELKEVVKAVSPRKRVPWKATVNRNERGFISDIDFIPQEQEQT